MFFYNYEKIYFKIVFWKLIVIHLWTLILILFKTKLFF